MLRSVLFVLMLSCFAAHAEAVKPLWYKLVGGDTIYKAFTMKSSPNNDLTLELEAGKSYSETEVESAYDGAFSWKQLPSTQIFHPGRLAVCAPHENYEICDFGIKYSFMVPPVAGGSFGTGAPVSYPIKEHLFFHFPGAPFYIVTPESIENHFAEVEPYKGLLEKYKFRTRGKLYSLGGVGISFGGLILSSKVAPVLSIPFMVVGLASAVAGYGFWLSEDGVRQDMEDAMRAQAQLP